MLTQGESRVGVDKTLSMMGIVCASEDMSHHVKAGGDLGGDLLRVQHLVHEECVFESPASN